MPAAPSTSLPDRLPISVCMIAGAEATRIGRSLAAVKDWVADLHVVINDNVTDGTDEVARQQGATVHRESWKGHVAQKNSAAAKATQPWVLGLDADEVVSDALRDELRRLFSERPSSGKLEDCAAYSFPRCTWVMGRFLRHGDWYPDRQTRLWQKDQARWAGEDPHDKLEVDGQTGRLRSDLLHFGVPDLNAQLAKIPRYTDDFVRQRLARGQSAGWPALVLRPWWTFVRGYFLRLGFLDGWQGYYVARMNAFTTLTRYTKLGAMAANRGPSSPSAGSGH